MKIYYFPFNSLQSPPLAARRLLNSHEATLHEQNESNLKRQTMMTCWRVWNTIAPQSLCCTTEKRKTKVGQEKTRRASKKLWLARKCKFSFEKLINEISESIFNKCHNVKSNTDETRRDELSLRRMSEEKIMSLCKYRLTSGSGCCRWTTNNGEDLKLD